ncbi:BRO family protein [Faecalibacillus intestinalis]|uniref:BRO family protein n=1 Tax=Faecalibacillus intestinalis TaxID=1982626 RepID=UPI0022E06452|nr:BRO family protein [Faecalibacillus intestinalis]
MKKVVNEVVKQEQGNNVLDFQFEGHDVRAIAIDGEPWFVGKDVAEALGYKNQRDAIKKQVEVEDKRPNVAIYDGRQNRKMTIINESGMYSLILSSTLPSAKKFKKWVTSEVLPSIRKNGGYIYGQENMSEDELLSRALILANSRILSLESKNEQLEEEKQDVTFLSELFVGSKDRWLTTEIANYYGMSAVKFNKLLFMIGLQDKVDGVWEVNEEYKKEGLKFMITTSKNMYENKKIVSVAKFNAWTKDGVKLIYNELKEHGVLPVIEQTEDSITL